MNKMSAKPRANFRRDGHRTVVIGTDRPNCKTDEDEVALSRHHALFHGTVNKPPIHEAYTVTFVEQSNFHSLNKCEDK